MKKLLVLFLFLFGVVSCNSEKQDTGKTKIILVLPGLLGDHSINDEAASGFNRAIKELNVEGLIIEAGPDQSKWEPALIEASEGGYDLIITGTWGIREVFLKIAQEYPDQKYLFYEGLFDDPILSNTYVINFKVEEATFLAGALAAMMTTSSMENINTEKLIGFVGGINSLNINNMLLGYLHGARFIDPEVKVDMAYVGSYVDPAKGKDMAIAQINRKSDVIIHIAGQTGLGVHEAASQNNIYAIGIDTDQSVLFKENSPKIAESIITSAIKKIGDAIYSSVEQLQAGTLELGISRLVGIKDGAVGLAKNDIYEKHTTPEMKQRINELETEIIAGTIVVDRAYAMTPEEVEQKKVTARAF